MKISIIPLIGGLVMLTAFFATIKITIANPSDNNVLISVAFILAAGFGVYKSFKKTKHKKLETEDGLTPVYD